MGTCCFPFGCIEPLAVTLLLWAAYRLAKVAYCQFSTPRTISRFGSVALVTGATDGIGQQIAIQLAKKGFSIIAVGRSDVKLADTKKIIEEAAKAAKGKNAGSCTTVVIDFSKTSDDDRKKLADAAANVKLQLGIVVNCAGISLDYPMKYHTMEPGLARRMIDVNCKSVLDVTEVTLPILRENQCGLVVNVSSGFGSKPAPLLATYGASKAFVTSFTHAMRKEYAKDGVVFQVLAPHMVVTKLSKCKLSIVAPSSEAFAVDAVREMARGCAFTCANPIHAIVHCALDLFPTCMTNWAIGDLVLKPANQAALRKRARMAAAEAQE